MGSPIHNEWQKFRQACTDLSTCLDDQEGWKRYRNEHPDDPHGYGFKVGMYKNSPQPTPAPSTPTPRPAVTPRKPDPQPATGTAIYRNPHDVWQERATRRMGLGIGPEFNDKI